MGGIMKNKNCLMVLVAATGIGQTAGAAPDGSRRLRGFGDRVFLVEAEVVASLLDELPVG